MKKIFESPFLYAFISLYIVSSYHVLTLGNNLGYFFLSEDRYFEYLGAVSFFITSYIFFYAFLKIYGFKSVITGFSPKKLVFLSLALMFFFGGGEEISWGQRIFDIQTPDALNEINAQGEVTVHNIEFGNWEIPFETMFDLLWLFLAVLVPFASLFRSADELLNRFLPIGHWGIGLLFLLNYFWAKVAKSIYLSQYKFDLVSLPFVQAVQEIKESNYSLLFVLFAFSFLISILRKTDE